MRVLIDHAEYFEDLTYDELDRFGITLDKKYVHNTFCLGPVSDLTLVQLESFDLIFTSSQNPHLINFVRKGGTLKCLT